MICRRILSGQLKLSKVVYRTKSTVKKARLTKSSLCLAYTTYEPRGNLVSDQPVIVTHGMMGNKGNWHSLCKVMSGKGRRVIAVDARNHGDSPHTDDMNFSLMSLDITDLMDELEIDKACLLGHSMGGKMSMVTALEHPERVDSLIVVDVSPSISPRAKTYPEFLSRMLEIQQKLVYDHSDLPLSSARQLASAMLEGVEEDAGVRQFLAANLIQTDGKFRWKVNLDSIINNFTQLTSFPKFADVQYKGPTLFIGGSNSQYISEKDIPEIKRLFPSAEICHVDGAGHWVHADKPQPFLQYVHNFLDKTGKSESIE